VLTIPFSIILIFLSIDVGRLVLVKTYLHDAATVSARAGARTGEIGTVLSDSGDSLCATTRRNDSTTYQAFCEAISSLPGGKATSFSVRLTDSTGTAGGRNSAIFCEPGLLYVEVEAKGEVDYLTDIFANAGSAVGVRFPGLRDITLRAVGVARCEVAR